MYKEIRGYVSLHRPELEELKALCEEELTDHYITDDEVRIDVNEEVIESLGKFLTLNEQEEAAECAAIVFYKH